MSAINKKDLASYVAGVNGIPVADAERIVTDLCARILSEIADGNTVNIVGFGKFEQKTRAARTGRNPHTGATIDIAEKKVITFKPAKQARDEVNA